jgi:hypothetical protein
LRLDDDGCLLGKKLGDAGLMRIEIRTARRIEQRQNTHDPFRRVAHGTGEYLVRRGRDAGHLRDSIDHDRPLLQLHPRQQMLLSALQRFGRHRLPASCERQLDVLVRHPEHRQGAMHVIQSRLQDQVELIGVAGGVRFPGGHFEHERQVTLTAAEGLFAGPEL